MFAKEGLELQTHLGFVNSDLELVQNHAYIVKNGRNS